MVCYGRTYLQELIVRFRNNHLNKKRMSCTIVVHLFIAYTRKVNERKNAIKMILERVSSFLMIGEVKKKKNTGKGASSSSIIFNCY